MHDSHSPGNGGVAFHTFAMWPVENGQISHNEKNDVRLLLILLGVMFGLHAYAEEENPVFDILEYRVEGSTVLPVGRIEEVVYPFLGEKKTVDDAEQARAALEKAFHAAGYLTVLVSLPEQRVDSGVVRLEVQEGRVEKLRVVGSHYYSLGMIKSRVGALAEGGVPYFPEVQKQLAAVNSADRQVAPVLRPGKTPGTVEVDLKVQDKLPFHGSIELNNKYTANTTKTRLSGSMRYDNLWQRDHSLGISFQVTPEKTDETKVLSANYLVPYAGDYWVAYGVYSKSNVPAIETFNSVGATKIYGMRYIHPLPGLDGYTHSLTLGVDYKDFEQTVDVTTPIDYLPFYAGYDGTWQTDASTTQMNMGVTFSVRGLSDENVDCERTGGSTQLLNEFECSRPFAKADFVHLRYEFKHTHKLFGNWQLFGSLAGQMTDQLLIPQEQFAVGGADSVRGYFESNSMGDYGYNGTVELRTPSFARLFSDQIADLHALAFYDFGHARVMDPLPEQIDRFNLASTGLGLYLKGWHGVFGVADYAMALRDAGDIERGDYRWNFRVGYEW